MDAVDNNDFLFHVFGCWKTIFRFYMDVVDNNDFLDVFMYLIVETIFGFYMDCG